MEFEGERISMQMLGALKKCEPADTVSALGGQPRDIDSFDAVCCGERAFGQGLAIGKELVQQDDEMSLSPAVELDFIAKRDKRPISAIVHQVSAILD
jgi:hypothetical protein